MPNPYTLQEVHNSPLTINTKKIFISTEAQIEQKPPAKAARGVDGDFEEEGGEGFPGETGKSIQMRVEDSLLTGSEHQLLVTLHGGEGGDGGEGGAGLPGVKGTPGERGTLGTNGVPGIRGADGHNFTEANTKGDATNCNIVVGVNGSSAGSSNRYGKEDHCCHINNCETYKYWQLFIWGYNAYT